MPIDKGIFGNRSNFSERYIPDHKQLGKLVEHWKAIGLKIVLTSGSFDIIHLGHFAFLEKAKEQGDLLIVGLDDDEKLRQRKGPDRPVANEGERLAALVHLRPVDVVTLKRFDEPKWNLIKTVMPDVLVVSEDTSYTTEQITELEANYCGQVLVLPRQAETTTTARLAKVYREFAGRLEKALAERVPEAIRAIVSEVLGDG